MMGMRIQLQRHGCERPDARNASHLPRTTPITHRHRHLRGMSVGRRIRDWPNRDPSGEQDGVNLYGMVGSNLVNRWDMLGLYPGVEGHGNAIPPEMSVSLISSIQRNADREFDRLAAMFKDYQPDPIVPISPAPTELKPIPSPIHDWPCRRCGFEH